MSSTKIRVKVYSDFTKVPEKYHDTLRRLSFGYEGILWPVFKGVLELQRHRSNPITRHTDGGVIIPDHKVYYNCLWYIVDDEIGYARYGARDRYIQKFGITRKYIRSYYNRPIWEYRVTRYRDLIKRCRVAIAFEADMIVGWSVIGPKDDPMFYVRKSKRRRGIATQLAAAMMKSIKRTTVYVYTEQAKDVVRRVATTQKIRRTE